MNLVIGKRKAAASWKSRGVHFAAQLRMTGNAFRFCAEQILVASPIGSRQLLHGISSADQLGYCRRQVALKWLDWASHRFEINRIY